MPTARSPPQELAPEGVRPTPHSERTSAPMDNDRISDFLAAVDDLRGDDETVRSTRHTSSVSAEGWPTAEAQASTAAAEGTDA